MYYGARLLVSPYHSGIRIKCCQVLLYNYIFIKSKRRVRTDNKKVRHSMLSVTIFQYAHFFKDSNMLVFSMGEPSMMAGYSREYPTILPKKLLHSTYIHVYIQYLSQIHIMELKYAIYRVMFKADAIVSVFIGPQQSNCSC
jgi:hypothetical protein